MYSYHAEKGCADEASHAERGCADEAVFSSPPDLSLQFPFNAPFPFSLGLNHRCLNYCQRARDKFYAHCLKYLLRLQFVPICSLSWCKINKDLPFLLKEGHILNVTNGFDG